MNEEQTIPTGFKKLDLDLKGGFKRGDLVVVGCSANPSFYKSLFSNFLKDKEIHISLEDSPKLTKHLKKQYV